MKKEIEISGYVVVGTDGEWTFAEEDYCKDSMEDLLYFFVYSNVVNDYVTYSGPVTKAAKWCDKYGIRIKRFSIETTIDFGDKNEIA